VAPLRRYLLTHVSWRVASVAFAGLMVVVCWTISRWLAYLFLGLGVSELLTLPYHWRRARRAR
jgi:hypothetical protein